MTKKKKKRTKIGFVVEVVPREPRFFMPSQESLEQDARDMVAQIKRHVDWVNHVNVFWEFAEEEAARE